MIKRDKSFYEFHFDIVFPPTRPRATGCIFYRRWTDMIVVLLHLFFHFSLLIVVAHHKKNIHKLQQTCFEIQKEAKTSNMSFHTSTKAECLYRFARWRRRQLLFTIVSIYFAFFLLTPPLEHAPRGAARGVEKVCSKKKKKNVTHSLGSGCAWWS